MNTYSKKMYLCITEGVLTQSRLLTVHGSAMHRTQRPVKCFRISESQQAKQHESHNGVGSNITGWNEMLSAETSNLLCTATNYKFDCLLNLSGGDNLLVKCISHRALILVALSVTVRTAWLTADRRKHGDPRHHRADSLRSSLSLSAVQEDRCRGKQKENLK